MSAAEHEPPKCSVRVVSLLPSATEMLALIGADIAGRSHECDWPNTVREEVPALTGAYNKFENSFQMHEAVSESLRSGQGLYWLDSELLAQLRPDAIVTQSLCAVCAVDLDIVRKAASNIFPPPRIIDTNPKSLEDVIADVRRLGAELGLKQRGEEAAAALQARVDKTKALVLAAASSMSGSASSVPKRVIFLEWTSPLFPGGHWTPQMIHMAGGICPVNPPRDGGGAAPSVETDPSVIVAADPDLIIVAPCGLDLEATRREVATLEQKAWWCGLRAVQCGKVVLVDGNQHFNRPGPRLVEALEWLVALMADRPELMPTNFPWEWLQQHPVPQPQQPMPAEVEAVEVEQLNSFTATTAAGGAIAISKTPGIPAAAPLAFFQEGRIRPLSHVTTAATTACVSVTGTPVATTPTDPCTSYHAATAAIGSVPTSAAVAVAVAATPSTGVVTACGVLSGEVKDTAAQQEGSGGSDVQVCCGCGGGGGDPTDPWVAACSPWSSAPHLPADIEDLHAAACENGESSYDDPETGFMVFTQLPLAKRGRHCCANRCRHCPWGHIRVTARPRLNRITRPTLLHPSPEPRQREQQSDQQQQLQGEQDQTLTQPKVKANGVVGVLRTVWRTVGDSGGRGPSGSATGAGGTSAVTLIIHEGCSASDSVAKVLANGLRARDPKQRVVLLVAFDVDSGALWGSANVAAKAAGGAADVRDISNYDSSGRSGTSLRKQYNATQMSAVMDTSLRLNLDLVAVPLQVRGRSWVRDQHAVQQALQYVVRVAAELLKETAITRVASVRPEEGTPPLFVHGTAGAVPGGWSEVLRRVNAQLASV